MEAFSGIGRTSFCVRGRHDLHSEKKGMVNSMQVVILAGGEGSRLRPITSDIPKPLVKVLGVPVIERLTALLFRCGFREATVADCYLANKLEERLGSFSNGVKINYVREDTPLGTAGCVRKAWNGGDDVLVVSGDSVCSFNFEAIAAFHQKNSADVTIVTHRVADPREYGLVTADDSGRIVGFLEKPGYDSCLTDVANTGAYVISKDVILRIPKDEKIDFAFDVFPQLLKEDKRMFSYPEDGIWHDIGDIPSLIKCQAELLSLENEKRLIFKGAFVSESAVIGEGSVIEDSASVGAKCRVMGSLISEGASIGESCALANAVLLENVTMGRGVTLGEYSCVGRDCVIGSAVTVDPGVRIASGTKIPSGAHIRSDISKEGYKAMSFGDFGEALGIELDASSCIRLGAAIGSALALKEVTVGQEGDDSPISESLCLGLRSVGTAVYLMNNASFGKTVFAGRRLNTKYCLYVGDDIRLMRSDRIELCRSEERKIELMYNRGELKETDYAPMINAEAAAWLYEAELKKAIPPKLQTKVTLKTDSISEAREFAKAFSSVLVDGGERAEFSVANDRRSVFCMLDNTNLSYEQLILLACKSYFSKRLNVRLHQRAPLSCDDCASSSGLTVTHVSASDDIELSPFAYDPLMLIAAVLDYTHQRGISLSAAAAELPEIVYTRRTVNVGEGLPKILSEALKDLRVGNDIVYQSDSARAYVRPMKSGKSLSLYVESVSQEAANDICLDLIKKLGINNGETDKM